MTRARQLAEAYFRTPAKTQDAKLVGRQVCPLPGELQADLDRLPESRRLAAFRIAIAPTVEAKRRLWLQVPALWRDDIAEAVGLMLGGVYGTRKPWAVVTAGIAADVPEAFRAEVEHQAKRVYELRLPRAAK